MREGQHTWYLTDQQKIRLLDLGLRPDGGEAADEDELRADRLCDLLRRPVPRQGGLPLEVGEPSREFDIGLRSVAGPSMGEVLSSSGTNLDVLADVKQYAKREGNHTESQVDKDVYLAIYLAAIARALVSNRRLISEHSWDNLIHFFNTLAAKPWVPKNLADLYHRATECGNNRCPRGAKDMS